MNYSEVSLMGVLITVSSVAPLVVLLFLWFRGERDRLLLV